MEPFFLCSTVFAHVVGRYSFHAAPCGDCSTSIPDFSRYTEEGIAAMIHDISIIIFDWFVSPSLVETFWFIRIAVERDVFTGMTNPLPVLVYLV